MRLLKRVISMSTASLYNKYFIGCWRILPMQRKFILVAAVLAVLCAGMTACGTSQNTETSSSAPSSSSELSSSSVSSVSVSSEPTSSSVSSASSSYQVTKEEDTTVSTGTETHPEDQVNVSDDKVEAAHNQAVEGFITRYMEETGATREEAEAWWQNHQNTANEEAEQKREDYNNQVQAEQEAHSSAIDAWYRENTGMSRADWLKLSIDEKSEWMYAHPDVDFSTSPEFQ